MTCLRVSSPMTSCAAKTRGFLGVNPHAEHLGSAVLRSRRQMAWWSLSISLAKLLSRSAHKPWGSMMIGRFQVLVCISHRQRSNTRVSEVATVFGVMVSPVREMILQKAKQP